MVTVEYDENTKCGECKTCCHKTTVTKTQLQEWDEKTNDWAMIWLCFCCTSFIKQCSFCARPTNNLRGRYNRETVKILCATGKVVCDDCCEHVMAATTATYAASVDTRPGHWKSSRMSDAEYEDAYFDLGGCDFVWTIYEYSMYHDLCDDIFSRQVDPEVEAAEDFYDKYDRQQAKKSVNRKKSSKKGNKKLSKFGKVCSTTDYKKFDEIYSHAKCLNKVMMKSENVIPSSPRDALKRMDVPNSAFSDLDMEMEIRTVWALDRPTTMTVSVPVPACLLKRREPLQAAEFGRLMVAVWKAYKGDIDRFLDWPDRHIFYFRESNLIVDFTTTPVEC